MIIRKVEESVLDKEPYQLWNAFVDLVAMEQYEDLNDIQRIAHLCFWYDAEVQNGGHLQYFENRGTDLIGKTIIALTDLGAECQAKILGSAVNLYLSKDRRSIDTVEDFVEEALEDEFGQFDSNYYECNPEITDLLEGYLSANQGNFVEIEKSSGGQKTGTKSKVSEFIMKIIPKS